MLVTILQCSWGLIGDFNEILSQTDKKSGRSFAGNSGLSRVIELCGLMELPFSGPQYTWINEGQETRQIYERIDCVL